MTDVDRSRLGPADEDRLPWLEAVEDEDDGGGVAVGKLVAAVVAALIFIGLVVGGVFWLRDRKPAGSGELIAAPEGDYKVPAQGADTDGMAVEGEGDAAYAASQGEEVNSTINPEIGPEAPVAGVSVDVAPVRTTNLPPSQAAQQGQPTRTASAEPAKPLSRPEQLLPQAKPAPAVKPATQTAAAPAQPASVQPAPSRGAGGGTIQLGAFNSEAIAVAEWGRLTGQFSDLGQLSRSITTVEVGGKTLYRLRASGVGAREACKTIRAAGKPCNPV